MDFLDFLNFSVTPYHTVEGIKALLSQSKAGGLKVWERGGALIAVRMPKHACADSKFRIALAHTDFPALKITPNPDCRAAGIQTLHPEIYGSPIYTSWLDRDLGYAGILAYEADGRVETKVFRSDKVVRIPQLAVHLNRGVNQDGLKVNPQTDLNALWTAREGVKFVDALKKEIKSFRAQTAKRVNAGEISYTDKYSGMLKYMLKRGGECNAQAGVFAVLLNHVGVECGVCHGRYLNRNGTAPNHYWNYAVVDGRTYYYDVDVELQNYGKGQGDYYWYKKTRAEAEETHAF